MTASADLWRQGEPPILSSRRRPEENSRRMHAGVSSRARARRLRGQRRHGGLFPLPYAQFLPGLDEAEESTRRDVESPALTPHPPPPPGYARQRRRRRNLRIGRVNVMVDCLNRLSCAAAEPGPVGHVEASRAPPTAPQSEALATVCARVRRAGPCPDDLSPQKALQELLKSKDLYSQEPQHLAEYDPSRLKILRTIAQPLPANTLLPPEEAAVFEGAECPRFGRRAVAAALHHSQYAEALLGPVAPQAVCSSRLSASSCIRRIALRHGQGRVGGWILLCEEKGRPAATHSRLPSRQFLYAAATAHQAWECSSHGRASGGR